MEKMTMTVNCRFPCSLGKSFNKHAFNFL